jgi:uncharacterized protein
MNPLMSPDRSCRKIDQQLPTALLNADAFPHAVQSLRLIETALSWVILTGEYAYKIKKPLHTDFIDASSLERRHFLCQQELQLNQRFSQGLYQKVAAIGVDERGVGFDRGERPIEYAVQMRQFEESQVLLSALSHSRVRDAEMSQFGADLARVHRCAYSTPPCSTYGTEALIEAQILANFSPLRTALQAESAALRCLDALESWTRTALRQSHCWLALRRSHGYVRECHGDLHTGNVVHWHGRWQPFDCLEFDPALRWIDVISDIAFLFMDLHARERSDLGYALLNAYLEHSGDYEGLRLLPLYGVYRALVRAKVAALSQQVPEVHRYLRVAQAIADTQPGALILMHGVTASGKSALSAQLAQALLAIRIRSDRERHRMDSDQAPYSPRAVLTTYRRLRFCADSTLAAGYSAIVDATFLERSRRGEFETLARQRDCPLIVVSCEAPLAVLEQRLRERQVRGDDPSEATAEVLAAQWHDLQPLDAAEHTHVVVVDTTSARSVAVGIEAVRARALSVQKRMKLFASSSQPKSSA